MNEGGGGGGPQNPADKAKQDALFEDREPKKIIRIITVTAYMCSVSFVGVVLSAYYIFLWHPPNPRLMHQQVDHEAHHEARVDYLYQPPDFTTVKAVDPNVLDLFKHASPGADTLKTRREIVKNVNAILSDHFEKVKFTQTSSSTEAAKNFKLNDNNDTSSSTFTPTKATDDLSTTSESFSSVSPEENEKPSSEASEDSISNDKTTTASTLTSTQISPSRRTKRPVIKKPHQTPFALKHLEVPIKLEPTRRRPIRFSTTTMKSDSSITSDSTEVQPHKMQIPRKMSAQNMMASISRTLGTRHGEEKAANEIKFANEESKDRLYEPKHKQKVVRVLTVVAYIISVSLAAIVLSLYYMYIWDPADHRKYIAKQRLEASKTPCPEIVTPVIQTEITTSLAEKFNGTLSDNIATSVTASSPDSSEVYENASPRHVAKSLYKMLTNPPASISLRDIDYSSSTDLPQIFPAIPRANDNNNNNNDNDDYHDATIAPLDDIIDD